MGEFKKNCYYCINGRPKKQNLCVVLGKKIADIHNYVCESFKADVFLQRAEEMLSKKDDDGSKRLWFFNYSPFKLAII